MSDTPKALSGSLSLAGTATKAIVAARSLSGVLTLSGNTTRVKRGYPITYGTIFLSGNLSLVVTKVPKPRPVTGILSMSGTLSLSKMKALSGTIRLSGTLTRQVTKSVSGNLSLYADLFAGKSNKLNILGALALSGSLLKDVDKSVAGSLSLSGTVSRQVTKALKGDLGLSGALLIKTPKMSPSGDLALTGTLGKIPEKALSGNLSLSGDLAYSRAKNLEGWLYLGREVSIDLSGDLDLSLAYVRAPEGNLALTGDLEGPDRTEGRLSMFGTLGTVVNHVKSLSGSLSLTGSATHPSNYTVSVEGGLTFMRVLTTYTTPYTYENVSLLNTAASKDIEIEQGVAFRRFYRWMKSDGIPFTLSGITLEMVITTSKGDPTIIAYSPRDITITTTGFDTGVFRVDITAAKSATFDFTRANYMIVAYWASTRVRLIEGEVQLSRTLFKRLSQTVAGDATLSGTSVKSHSRSLSGDLAVAGTDALSAISASVGTSGTLSLSGGVETET